MTQDLLSSQRAARNLSPDHLATANGTSALAPLGPSADALTLTPVLSETARIIWIEVLETGVAELDAWHRQLVSDTNRLLELTAHRAPWLQIVAASMLLTARLLDHFRFEERIMEQYEFPRRDAHTSEHRRIEAQLSELLARIREVDGSQEERCMLATSFKSVLIDLMVRHDLDYCSHLLHRLGR